MEVEMEELKDYSGELRPNLKMEDFSKEAVLRLWMAAVKLYLGLDGIWYSLIKERFDESTAKELDAEVWRRTTPLDVKWHREAMNNWGNDVESVLKHIQIDAGSGAVFPGLICDLIDKNHGILTVKRCLGLDYWERHGETELQKHECETVDAEGFQDLASLFNPKMKATALKIPPRKSKDEIACQWEFKLEE